jgi:hypothetical protein
VKRTFDVAGKTVVATALLAFGLAGCSAINPAVITTPYPASDGVAASLPGTSVALRNFLVVGAAKGSAAEVVGAVVNTGSTPVQVSLQAAVGASSQPTQTQLTVPANAIMQVGPGQATDMQIADLAVDPGQVLGLTASTAAGGRADLSVPVLLPQNEYADLTPGPTPTDTATPSDGATPINGSDATGTPTAGSSAGTTATSTSDPSATNQAKKSKHKKAKKSDSTPTATNS